jgi:hypothetical protein
METLFGFDDLASPAADPCRRREPGETCRQAVLRHIVSINPSATPGFLAQFTDEQLDLYLRHLLSAQRPRGRDAVWIRPGETRAISMTRSAA